MRKRLLRMTALAAAALLAVVFTLSAGALDDKYRFDDLKMSVSIPKEFYVITRDSESDDDVFSELELDYDETMDAFENSDIYLRAYDPDKTYWISVVVTVTDESKSINNYSDISASDRKDILETLRSEDGVDDAVEVKHNDIIFFDSSSETTSEDRPLYVERSNTVVNGMQIDLILQKYDEEISHSESTDLTDMADSLEFDKIIRKTGPIFEWWRLLLWVALLAGLSIALSVLYKHRNAANRRKLQERRKQREQVLAEENGAAIGDDITFDEALGYQDDTQFSTRAPGDLDDYTIKIREHDPKRGMDYFEDSGDSIDDGSDYFDTYFREPVETRRGVRRFFGAIATYIKIAVKHTGYFFKNLKRAIFNRKK